MNSSLMGLKALLTRKMTGKSITSDSRKSTTSSTMLPVAERLLRPLVSALVKAFLGFNFMPFWDCLMARSSFLLLWTGFDWLIMCPPFEALFAQSG